MAKEVKLPPLGENIESGDIVSILVAEGDTLSEEQAILELETDKATVEVPSEVAGRVKKIHVSEGDRVEVGQLILTVSDEEADTEEKEAPEKEDKAEETEEVEEAEESEEAGSEEEDEESEKSEEAEAPEDQEEEDGEGRKEEGSAGVVDFKKRQSAEGVTTSDRLVPASPAVRRFAREIGIDISRVEGTGPRGRISVDDVKAHSRELQKKGPSSARGAMPTLPDFSQWGEIDRQPFSKVREATARHMATAWSSIPHVTNHDEADVTELEELRKRYSKRVEEAGGKLTVTAIALKIVAAGLEVFPKLNASLDIENQEIVYKKYCHIGVAVDTDRGLLVPVIRNVREKNITELSGELKEIAERARQGKISLEELKGGCFTITNLGGIGGTSFTPIVNFPEVAILGMSRTTIRPVFIGGEFKPRKIMPLSLSYDHRLVDGADAARFLRWLVEAFEDPFLMSLEG